MPTQKGYLPNYLTKYEIGATAEELHELAQGIQTVDAANDEESEDIIYYSHRGGKQSDITSITQGHSFKGHRNYGEDLAQEFVRDALSKPGLGRICYFRVTEPDGRIREGEATISGIVHTGGDANARGTFECTITFNGLPDDGTGTPPSS